MKQRDPDITTKVKEAAQLLAADENLSVASAARSVGLNYATLRYRLQNASAPAATRPDYVMEAVAALVS